jgi:hypothetical protein
MAEELEVQKWIYWQRKVLKGDGKMPMEEYLFL